MAMLRFKFADLIRETKALKTIAKRFLDSNSSRALDQLGSDLESIWSADQNRASELKLSPSLPLRTIPSGDYETRNRQGGPQIYGVITGIWEVRPRGDNPRKPKARLKRELEFCGKASTKIELYDTQNTGQPIAMWRMEHGSEDAPGCYFHVQILGDRDEPPFPGTLPIPRFPSIFVTPMGVVEYVLGELFQHKWQKEAAGTSGDLAYWHKLQGDRLISLLKWQQAQLHNLISSPWMTLKAAKPDGDMFLK